MKIASSVIRWTAAFLINLGGGDRDLLPPTSHIWEAEALKLLLSSLFCLSINYIIQNKYDFINLPVIYNIFISLSLYISVKFLNLPPTMICNQSRLPYVFYSVDLIK